MKNDLNTGKLPGKAIYAGRRRPMTRKAGFKSHPDSTGGEFRSSTGDWGFFLLKGQTITVTFDFDVVSSRLAEPFGFGLYWSATADLQVTPQNIPGKVALQSHPYPCWSKIGSFWLGKPKNLIKVTFEALSPTKVFIYGPIGGKITNSHLSTARTALIGNMHTFAPETVFVAKNEHAATVALASTGKRINASESPTLYLKSCNRCARFLPINIGGSDNSFERCTLSFSNHCVADHRRPCKHTGFGRLRDVDSNTQEILQLDYGFQLECRFCKKFEVNAMHNPQRTASQMKEDGTRRRFFELLLTELYRGSPQLRFRFRTGNELTDEVYKRFNGRCFMCDEPLPTPKAMHLDHTRPLALLWPLDEFATCLCEVHNNEKRDRFPSEYYAADKLSRLAEITGLPFAQLSQPTPNMDAIRELQNRMDWFVNVFLQRPEMTKVRDGKCQGDLLVKALSKCLSRCPGGPPFDLHVAIASARNHSGR